MQKRRRRRRRRIRITPRGYLVLGVFVLSLLLIVLLCLLFSKKPATDGEAKPGGAYASMPSDASTPEASLAPIPTPTPVPTPIPSPTTSPALSSAGVRLPSAEQEAGAATGMVRSSGVALRKGSSKSYGIIRKCEADEKLIVYGAENGYTFVKTVSDNQYGYMATEFVQQFGLYYGQASATPLPASQASATPLPASQAGAIAGVVNVKEMYLRSMPSKDGNEPLGLCVKDTQLWVYFQTDKWYYVEIAATGEKGYLYAQYILTESAVPTGTPVP